MWFVVRNGYSCLPVALAKDLNIRVRVAVREIITNTNTPGVQVVTSDALNGDMDRKVIEGKLIFGCRYHDLT